MQDYVKLFKGFDGMEVWNMIQKGNNKARNSTHPSFMNDDADVLGEKV